MLQSITSSWLLTMISLILLVKIVFSNSAEADGRTVETKLRFPRTRHVREDDWKEFAQSQPKLKRWEKENNTIEHDPINMEEQIINVLDAFVQPEFTVSILCYHQHLAYPILTLWILPIKVGKNGFELVDLHPRILPFLRTIKKQGKLIGNRVGPTTAGSWNPFLGGGTDEALEDQLARQLQGSDSFSLGGDTFHYAFRCAGFVIRKGGPEGSKLNGTGFDMVAQRVHIDQDITGEPLLSMGLTWVFQLPFMHLLNVWSPLHDVRLRPMAFADTRTINVAEDVVRYRTNSTPNAGGRFGSFRSDRLMSLYSPKHKWYWFPDMRFGQAVAFDTSNVPHSSFTLPGERTLSLIRNDILELYEQPDSHSKICSNNEFYSASSPDVSLDMEAFIGSAAAFKRRACEKRASKEDFEQMLEFITRASLEIRCVTMVVPKHIAKPGMAFIIFNVVGVVTLLLRRLLRGKPKQE